MEEQDTGPRPSVTVADLDNLVAAIQAKRQEIEAQEKIVSALNIDLSKLKQTAVHYLKELGREKYQTPFGTISIQQKWRVNMPQTDEDKQALFAHLRERGLFEKYATVNSQSLNSLFMADWEAAQKRGEGMDFHMPGIGEPKLFEDLGIRKS
jgi:hypothetical protein